MTKIRIIAFWTSEENKGRIRSKRKMRIEGGKEENKHNDEDKDNNKTQEHDVEQKRRDYENEKKTERRVRDRCCSNGIDPAF
jgi:hypothetical protein